MCGTCGVVETGRTGLGAGGLAFILPSSKSSPSVAFHSTSRALEDPQGAGGGDGALQLTNPTSRLGTWDKGGLHTMSLNM